MISEVFRICFEKVYYVKQEQVKALNTEIKKLLTNIEPTDPSFKKIGTDNSMPSEQQKPTRTLFTLLCGCGHQ